MNVMRKFKFSLIRQALDKNIHGYMNECCMGYLHQVQSKCSRKIQVEAARIVTGATKLVSLDMLYRETSWKTLESRRRNHKLYLLQDI